MQTVRSCNDARVNKDIVVMLEFEVLHQLGFEIYQPTILEFLAKFELLLKIDSLDRSTVDKIRRLATKMCKYCAQNSSFLEYRPQVMAAGSLLVSIKLCGAFNGLWSKEQTAEEFDPRALWDREIEE